MTTPTPTEIQAAAERYLIEFGPTGYLKVDPDGSLQDHVRIYTAGFLACLDALRAPQVGDEGAIDLIVRNQTEEGGLQPSSDGLKTICRMGIEHARAQSAAEIMEYREVLEGLRDGGFCPYGCDDKARDVLAKFPRKA